MYMSSEYHVTDSRTKVCILHKFNYDLKQVSEQRYSKLSSLLISLGYQQFQCDHSL